MLSVNWKHVQLVKIYMPCNFEVNLITCLGVIPLFSSFFSSPDPKEGLPSRISSIKLPLPWENLLCHLNTYKRLTLECVTDCLMNLCVSVGVFPMSTQNFIAAPLLHFIWKRSFFRWRRFHLQDLKTGLRSHLRVLPTQILQMWRREHYQRHSTSFIQICTIKWKKIMANHK
jgi:hypothetical protein